MNWSPPQRIERRGQFVALTPLDAAADLAELYQASHDPVEYQSVWTYLPNGPYADSVAMQTVLQRFQHAPEFVFFTATSLELQRKIGQIAIMSIDANHGRAELGHIWYSPLVQRSKINTEATYLLLAYLFDDLGYRRVEWKCNNENIPSRTTAQRMGFVYEGLFRQHMLVKGRNRDTAWFAMLDHEWPQRKANFERFLYSGEAVSLTELNR